MVRLVYQDNLTTPSTVNITQKEALEQIKKNISTEGNGFLELAAEDKDKAHFQVAVNEKAEYEIWDPAGVAIPNLNPPLSLNDNNSARKVIQRLVHLTKYSNVKGIENLDPASPLSRKVVAEIFKAPPGFEPGDRPTNLESVTSDGNVNVAKVGQKLILRIRNNTDKVLNLTVFDLQPDYGITQVYPTIQDGGLYTH